MIISLVAETMEKLQKREKEVSALTSQVEGLKSQLAGKRRDVIGHLTF